MADLSNTATVGDAVKAWNKYAADAPSEIKPQVQDIAKYVTDVANHDFTDITSMAQKIGTDGEQIGQYYATHCHG